MRADGESNTTTRPRHCSGAQITDYVVKKLAAGINVEAEDGRNLNRIIPMKCRAKLPIGKGSHNLRRHLRRPSIDHTKIFDHARSVQVAGNDKAGSSEPCRQI